MRNPNRSLVTAMAAGTVLLALALPQTPAAAAASPPPGTEPFEGQVVETMDAGGYTYVLVAHASDRTWVASRAFEVQPGERVQVPGGWVMKNFQSTTLNRTFEWILFSPRVAVPGRPAPTPTSAPAEAQLPPGHPQLADAAVPPHHPPLPTTPVEVRPGSVKRVTGGETVADCLTKARQLAGRKVGVRGVVVKSSDHILGRNWLHLRDGTGEEGANDLVVTTKQQAAPGDTVVVRGKLTRDRDFGAGYRFNVLVEDAELRVEHAAAPRPTPSDHPPVTPESPSP